MKKLDKLKSMLGKIYLFNDIAYRFIDYKQNAEKIEIETDKGILESNIYDLLIFLEGFKEENVALIKAQVVHLSSISKNHLEALRDTLLNNIEKVKQDAKYVPQAKEISNSINSIINLAKLEIEMRTKL